MAKWEYTLNAKTAKFLRDAIREEDLEGSVLFIRLMG